MNWPFDQVRDVATITTRQVIYENLPILIATHYSDDHSWAFLCGTTNNEEDAMVVGMGRMIDMDETLFDVANLPPGWGAHRESVESKWVYKKRVDDT